jgi:hypothetical protein
MPISDLDSNQIIQKVYEAGTESLNVNMSGTLIQENFDYIGVTYPSGTQEVYTYKAGGSGGTTVGIVTIDYVDATKAQILSVARS